MFKKILHTPWAGLGLVLLLLALAAALLKLEPRLRLLDKETANLKNKITAAQAELEQLKQNEQFFHSDTYLERQARLKLNYKKPDEQVVFVYRNEYNAGQAPDEPSLGIGLWNRFLSWLKGK